MKIESVNVDEILGTESKGIYGVHEEEKRYFSRSFSTRKIDPGFVLIHRSTRKDRESMLQSPRINEK